MTTKPASKRLQFAFLPRDWRGPYALLISALLLLGVVLAALDPRGVIVALLLFALGALLRLLLTIREAVRDAAREARAQGDLLRLVLLSQREEA